MLLIPSIVQANSLVDRAKPYMSVLKTIIAEQWPTMPNREIPPAQVGQESSWKEKAQLKTSRELGRGFVQLTIAYNKDGSIRFNAYQDAVRMKALQKWNWQDDPFNTKFQLTYLVLTDKSNFSIVRKSMKNDEQAWKAALVCYNAGEGRWLSRRTAARKSNIPIDTWDNGLAIAHSNAEAAILYGRPLYEAVNEYPRVIFKASVLYLGLM